MAEKDILEKVLMSYADVFADCINVLMYSGKRRFKPEDIQPAPTESFYRGRKRIHNQFCDISYYLVKDGAVKAQYIIENETQLRKRQVLRKFSYEGGIYRKQLKAGKPVYPVISMVIDWNRKNTRIPLGLRGLLLAESEVLQEDLQLVDDIKLMVHHMRNLPKEVRDEFTSDIGFVADYLNAGSFEGRRTQKIEHIEALCEMMEALTGDVRFTAQVEEFVQKQKEGRNIIMCEYIDFLEAKGKIEGENRLASLLMKLYSQGRDEDARLAVRDENARRLFYDEFCIAY